MNSRTACNRLSEHIIGRGKGLGKGGAKKHRKVLRDIIQGITKPAIHHLVRRGGVKRKGFQRRGSLNS
uniref:Histone H4 n=1 Tax=Lutzomyia longipalpis TaxID=7200 RepID=A0A7G3AEG1_LUTLO